MKVLSRNPELKYPRHIRQEKVMLVLDWLLEFRFSTIPVLAARIGQTPVNAHRFFRSMLDDGLIQAFANVHTKHYRYVMLTAAGVSYLEAEGRDISGAVTRTARLGRYARIVHDLSVQACMVKRLEAFEEVIAEHNLGMDFNERPDVVAIHKDFKYPIAFEFERWRKDRKRIFHTLRMHARNLEQRRYSGVYYLFENQADMRHYQTLFDEAVWPSYRRQPHTGKVVASGEPDYRPDSVLNLRKVFRFIHDPVSGDLGLA